MSYRLDKNYFWMGKVEEQPSDSIYQKSLSMEERLRIAMYLNSVAYNFDVNNPPKLDRTVFFTRKRS